MRIKVTPEVQADEDILFCQKWAEALHQAEDLLANCIELHLEKVIERCDDSICDKVNNTLEIINKVLNFEGDPFDVLRATFTEAKKGTKLLKRESGKTLLVKIRKMRILLKREEKR